MPEVFYASRGVVERRDYARGVVERHAWALYRLKGHSVPIDESEAKKAFHHALGARGYFHENEAGGA